MVHRTTRSVISTCQHYDDNPGLLVKLVSARFLHLHTLFFGVESLSLAHTHLGKGMLHLLECGVYTYYLEFFNKTSLFFLIVLENIFISYVGSLVVYLVLLVFEILLSMNICCL